MEEKIGRYLKKEEFPHHRNFPKFNNSPDNLELWSKRHPYGYKVFDQILFGIKTFSLYCPNFLSEKAKAENIPVIYN